MPAAPPGSTLSTTRPVWVAPALLASARKATPMRPRRAVRMPQLKLMPRNKPSKGLSSVSVPQFMISVTLLTRRVRPRPGRRLYRRLLGTRALRDLAPASWTVSGPELMIRPVPGSRVAGSDPLRVPRRHVQAVLRRWGGGLRGALRLKERKMRTASGCRVHRYCTGVGVQRFWTPPGPCTISFVSVA